MNYKILMNLILLNLHNNKIAFKGYDKLKLLSFKNFKIFLYNINRFFAKSYFNLINIIIKLTVNILLFIIKIFNFKILMNFVKINKMYVFVKRILKKLILFKRKKLYKKKLVKYLKKKRNIDINVNMITIKLKRKRKLNSKLKKNKDKFFKYLYNYLYYENTILSLGKFFDKTIMPLFNKIHYISLKIMRILRIFDKNLYSNSLHLKINKFIKKFESINFFITEKMSVVKLVKNLDEIFYTFFVNRIFKKLKKKKRYRALYIKQGVIGYILKFIFVILILFKSWLTLKLLYNSDALSHFLGKYEIFFSSKNLLNYYLTRYISKI